jgi:hypothetical protein
MNEFAEEVRDLTVEATKILNFGWGNFFNSLIPYGYRGLRVSGKFSMVSQFEFLFFFRKWPCLKATKPLRGPPFFLRVSKRLIIQARSIGPKHRAEASGHSTGSQAHPHPPAHRPGNYNWFFIIAIMQT